EYEHIPGVDYLGRGLADGLEFKQVSSVAAQLGKKQVMSETFACTGWDVTPLELKTIAEAQYVYGINLMCQHLLPYAEYGQRKRDYPAHFSKINPWINKHFKEFNDYFSRLGELLSESEEIVDVGVIHPIKSAYLYFKRDDTREPNYVRIESGLSAIVEYLSDNHVQYHFIDEDILRRHGKVDGDVLKVGKCAYKFVILPEIDTLSKSTDAFLREYTAGGGKLCAFGNMPAYLEGEEHDFGYLKPNISLGEILNAQLFKTSCGKDIRSCVRKDKSGKTFAYVVNIGEKKKISIDFFGAENFASYDVLTGDNRLIGRDMTFLKGESRIIYPTDETPAPTKRLSPVLLDGEFGIKEKVKNYLTLDFNSYSFDGVNYSERKYHLYNFDELLRKRYKGDLYIKYTFDAEEVPSVCEVIAEDDNIVEMKINGVPALKKGESDLDHKFFVYDVGGKIKRGRNEIVIKIYFHQREEVYYALFGENVTETLRNCLVYDTNIEPLYLCGDFGVKGEFRGGKTHNVVKGKNFSLCEQPKKVSSLITGGFPFFAGDIRLEKKIFVEDVNSELMLVGRFHIAEIYVNGKYLTTLVYNNTVDASSLLKAGENDIEIVLTVGNRNLFGPAHCEIEEPFGVGPDTFYHVGAAERQPSPEEEYNFVKTIL
ncbi:MAG: hypothetical protein J5903_04570, partial [Clostridia bacterium]|nr:hypothetical protein [Clostridia bacterium]